MCFNVDGRLASELITGAVGQVKWEVEIFGKASHAGVAPDRGISATLAAALALAEAQRQGWFGKVVKKNGHGTSNPGIFGGKDGKAAGDATNVVTDYVYVRGETRSPDEKFAAAIAEGYREAFKKAAEMVKDTEGETARMEFTSKPAYPPFDMTDDEPAVVHAKKSVEALGLKPTTIFSNGGLDANWLFRHGVPTVTIGAGQYEIHTVKEYVDIDEFAQGCRLAAVLATLES
jgi:tripeptide aminopeptidase